MVHFEPENQKRLRAAEVREIRSMAEDRVDGEDAFLPGHVYLPATFTGSPRAMAKRALGYFSYFHHKMKISNESELRCTGDRGTSWTAPLLRHCDLQPELARGEGARQDSRHSCSSFPPQAVRRSPGLSRRKGNTFFSLFRDDLCTGGVSASSCASLLHCVLELNIKKEAFLMRISPSDAQRMSRMRTCGTTCQPNSLAPTSLTFGNSSSNTWYTFFYSNHAFSYEKSICRCMGLAGKA